MPKIIPFELLSLDEVLKSWAQDKEIHGSRAWSVRAFSAIKAFHSRGPDWAPEVMAGYFVEGLLSHLLYRETGLNTLSDKEFFTGVQSEIDKIQPLLQLFNDHINQEQRIRCLNKLAQKIKQLPVLEAIGAEYLYIRVLIEKMDEDGKSNNIELITACTDVGARQSHIIHNWVRYFASEMKAFLIGKAHEDQTSIEAAVEDFIPKQCPVLLLEELNTIYDKPPRICNPIHTHWETEIKFGFGGEAPKPGDLFSKPKDYSDLFGRFINVDKSCPMTLKNPLMFKLKNKQSLYDWEKTPKQRDQFSPSA